MKHLMLFEAFDSIKLSKVFSYLSKDGKNKFLSDLKLVSDYLDYPLSEFSDNDFQYLPFKKAWELNNPDAKGVEMFKFWFDKDGNYIDKTIINGEVEKVYTQITDRLSSDDINDYFIISDELDISEVNQLKSGQLVYLYCTDGSGPAYIWRSPFGEIFALQNFANGSTPRDFNYRDIARFSWVIKAKYDYRSIRKIAYKGEVDGVEPELEFNIKADFYKISDKIGIKTNYTPVIKEKSNFALVLDITKLPQRSLSKLKKQRFDRKEGAFKTDDEIKSENIQRYFNELFKDEKIISNPHRVVKVYLTGKDILFHKRSLYILNKLEVLSRYYYKVITENDSSYLDKIRLEIFSFKKDYEKSKKIKDDSYKKIKNELYSDRKVARLDNEVYLKYIKNIEDLSELIYNKLLENKIENIYDIETIANKLHIIRYRIITNDNINDILYTNNINSIKHYLYGNDNHILNFNKYEFYRLRELIKRL